MMILRRSPQHKADLESLENSTVEEQFKRDIMMWKSFLEHPGDPAAGEIVKKIFTVLRWGGLLFRTENTSAARWQWWADMGWPLASVLSHGGRAMFQLSKGNLSDKPSYHPPTQHDNQFWDWLTDGNSGRTAAGLKRRYATHGISLLDQETVLDRKSVV